jgi:hypothetical protein
MTADEKRDRRRARQQLEKVFRPHVTRNMGLYATNHQITAAVKTLVDRYYAEQVRPAAERIEAQLIEEAQQKAAVSV